eukprot:210398-Pleurochrysis_carterae.AAC.1
MSAAFSGLACAPVPACLSVRSGVRASTVVILKGLFTAEEATEADADFYANLKQDVQASAPVGGGWG